VSKAIFVSYSTKHTDVTEALVAQVEAQFGLGSVWWDHRLRAGETYSPEITQALDAAAAVVVVWTQGALTSNWVYAEATRAASQRKVVSVRTKDVDRNSIPLPFNIYHDCLIDNMRAVLDAIDKLLKGEASPLPSGRGIPGFLLDPRQEPFPARAIAKRPASLLLAKHRLVPFDDFHGLRKDFVAWATGQPAHAMGSTVLGRIFHGPGGMGKTRTLIEIADELMRNHRWLAGFVPRDVRGAGRELAEGALERLILGGSDSAGLLLVVDHAERRQEDVTWLADRLLSRSETNAAPARLVLLSRGVGEWWKELVPKSQSLQDIFGLGGGAYDEIEMPENIPVQSRRTLFTEAVYAFLELRNSTTTEQIEPARPSEALINAVNTERDFDRPIALEIAALLHVSGQSAGDAKPGMEHLIDMVLGLEYGHWDDALMLDPRSNWPAALRNGVTLTTLVGGTEDDQAAEALIGRDPLYRGARDIDVPRARGALAALFPAVGGGLAALGPDLIGEHHVAKHLTTALVDACLDWTGDDRTRRQQILTVLNRASRPEHGAAARQAEAQLSRLIETRAATLAPDLIKVGIESSGALLSLCRNLEAQLDNFDQNILEQIDAALSVKSVALMELSLHVAQRRTAWARELDAQLNEEQRRSSAVQNQALGYLAGLMNTLGVRFSNLGKLDEALSASREAVDIHRRLAETDPDNFRPNLASSLQNRGNQLAKLGRHDEALEAAAQAVELYRSLAKNRPDRFLPDLATSLNSLGNHLSDLGRREAALAAIQEAVDIYRPLADARPKAFLHRLALALNNLGNRLSNLGHRNDALAAGQQAADIYRRLADAQPDAYLPDLAMSLDNLGNRLLDAGRPKDAGEATRKAVDIYRRLADDRPEAFLSDLAMSLGNLAGKLVRLELREEALAAAQEAVAIFRRLAGPRPDAFLPGLATSLNLLGKTFSDLGRRDEALTATRDGLDIRRRLAQVRPEKFLPDVASSLNNLGRDLAALGQYDEAQSAAQESVSIHRRLAKAQPKEFLPVLARGLGALGATVAGAGRHHDAATAFHEGLAVLAPFLEDEGETFRDLADGLLRSYVAACEKSGTPADETLLNAVRPALNRAALKAKMRAILDDANKSGHLDEAAVSTLPPELAKLLRDFWATGQTKG
jgi:tetratricopeptide (TPR) repeat protein